MKPTEMMKDIFEKALVEIRNNFNGQEATEKTQRAMQVISVFKGFYQAEAHRDAIQYAIIRDVASDPAEIKKYVASSLPHVNPLKLIGGKEK